MTRIHSISLVDRPYLKPHMRAAQDRACSLCPLLEEVYSYVHVNKGGPVPTKRGGKEREKKNMAFVYHLVAEVSDVEERRGVSKVAPIL